MQVKCRVCGKKIEKQDAYAVITDKDRKYYCSKEELDDFEAKKKLKNDIYDIICDIFGYKIQNSALFKEQKSWHNLCDDEKIFAYLQENRDYITNTIKRLDSSEFAKIRYFSAILKNNLHDFASKNSIKPIEEKQILEIVVDDDYIMPVNRKKKTERRKGFGE